MDRQDGGEPWYGGGLSFQCQGCGDCCRGPGGYVWVTVDEAKAIAAALGRDFGGFAASMLRKTPEGLALVDDAHGNCPLLGDDGRCKLYAERPMQCKTWPWWEENLISPERWNNAARRCPGMNRGEVHSRFVIECEKDKMF